MFTCRRINFDASTEQNQAMAYGRPYMTNEVHPKKHSKTLKQVKQVTRFIS